MLRGFHTIKSGFSSDYDDFSNPRLHRMDNGDYQSNFFLRDIELIPQNNDRSGANQDTLDGTTIFFVVGTTASGATPQSAVGGDTTVDDYDLRLSDSRQIAWGCISPAYAYQKVIIDPGHIIVDDIYVNCWSFNSGGDPIPAAWDIGYMLHIQNVEETGTQALVSSARQSAVDD